MHVGAQARRQPVGEHLDDPAEGVAVAVGSVDLGGCQKYDRADVRDILERASARETAARVAVGALCRQLLEACGITVTSRVVSIGGATETAAQEALIAGAKAAGDTLGGCFEVTASGLMPGLGSHIQWDRRLDGQIAAAIVSIPAIKGVEFGEGFRSGELPGSQVHDEIFYSETKGYYRNTNRAGGIEGGMTNGEILRVRAAMKPISTVPRARATVDVTSGEAAQAIHQRSDVCAVPAAGVVAEAMVALVLADCLLEKFGGDSVAETARNVQAYLAAIPEGMRTW